VRAISVAVLSLLLFSSPASGQALVLQGSAGPTITDSGHSVAAGIGFSPTSRLTVFLGVERTHLSSRLTTDDQGRVSSAFRGGTITFAAAELRATLLRRDRLSPYVLGGFGAGVSRPNVNGMFPDRVSNYARVLFVGGGDVGLNAVDATTGETLWRFPLDARTTATPMTYRTNGKQYVVIAKGQRETAELVAFAIP